MRHTIGFLTPYKHLPYFKSYAEKNCKAINMTIVKKNELKYFKGVDYLFAAPNYLKYIIEEDDIKDLNLKGIISPSTGTNHINVKSIPIIDIYKDPILNLITSTAEHNLYLMLAILRKTKNIRELSELNLGILGYGRLGKILHNITKNIFKKISISDKDYMHENFFEDTDILSININLNKSNIDFIDKDYINKFKKNLFIINTARGEVVNEDDILDLITQGKVLGYATDVIKEEHSSKATNLRITSDYRILITPHIGGTAIEAQEKAYKKALSKIL